VAGFWQNILSSLGGGGTAFYSPRVTYLGAAEFAAMANPSSMTAAQMWESQPHFRTVVTFIARNIAQLGLHSFERVDQTDRRRDRESVLAQTVQDVDGHMTTFELVFALVGDLALYDRAYWWAAPSSEMPSGWMIRRLPPTWVEPVMANPWEVKEYKAYIREDATPEIIPADKVLAFPGYHPGKMHGSSPTVDALRQTLQEQVEAATYRSQVWKRGGRVSSVIERPKDAPAWTESQASRFRSDWYANFTGNGPRAGGTPVLEDGMTLKQIDFSAKDQQYVEAAKLSLTTVASAFHVNPTMIGQNDGANYSNVREFRKMLYGDTLGPLVAQIEGRINTFLIPRIGMDRRRFYVEFNIEEKLQGNFEEQGAILQTATGGPWMTRNEARAMRNLPAIEGGDDLIVPLNVITGGQASPSDSGSQNLNSARFQLVKARVKGSAAEYEIKAPEEIPEDHQKAMAKVFAEFFARQRRSVLSAAGAKDPNWWDADRWDEELTDDLLGQSLKVTEAVAVAALADMGEDPDKYSVDRTKEFLKAVSGRIARQVNAATLASLEDAFEDDDPDAPTHVFDVAEESRAEQSGMTAAATYVGFGMVEAARQTKPQATKRWQVNSGNPRSSHAGVNGEEVPIDDDFSNGLKWPGSFNGDVDEVANCQCSVVIIT
jgi:HK97 family phage portal protein